MQPLALGHGCLCCRSPCVKSRKAGPVLFMLVTASRQCCPTGPVQGPHRRTGPSLLCGEVVHYGLGSVRAPRGQLRYKAEIARPKCGTRVGVLLRTVKDCLWRRALSESTSREAFNCRCHCDRLVACYGFRVGDIILSFMGLELY